MANKIKKVILREFNDLNKKWNDIYPKTFGDLIQGQVSDSKLFDGYETKDFMPSTFKSALRIVSDLNTEAPQSVMCKSLFVSNDGYDKHKNDLNGKNGSILVQNDVYVNNGTLKLSTIKYVDDIHAKLISGNYDGADTYTGESGKNTSKSGEIYNHLVYRSEKADKLTKPVRINEVEFDGSKDIQIPFYVVSNTPPANTTKLWIKADTHTLYYYNGSKWMPTTSVWYEDKDKGI